jgi:hypothetical protein
MLTDRWSPIGALLSKGIEPITLKKDMRGNALATGIWRPGMVVDSAEIQACKNPEELFWSIFAKVSERAMERRMLISLIARPGWAYDHPGILPKWSAKEITKADRVVWQRIP